MGTGCQHHKLARLQCIHPGCKLSKSISNIHEITKVKTAIDRPDIDLKNTVLLQNHLLSLETHAQTPLKSMLHCNWTGEDCCNAKRDVVSQGCKELVEKVQYVLQRVLARGNMLYRGKSHMVQGLLARTMQVHCVLEVYMCSWVWRISSNK
jgi:hypothetical protein